GDYLFYWRGKLPPLESMRFRTVRWSAVVAYLLGTAAAYFGGLAGIRIPPLNGIIVAGLALPVCEAIFPGLGGWPGNEVCRGGPRRRPRACGPGGGSPGGLIA